MEFGELGEKGAMSRPVWGTRVISWSEVSWGQVDPLSRFQNMAIREVFNLKNEEAFLPRTHLSAENCDKTNNLQSVYHSDSG